MRVLVVDDDEMNRELIVRLLSFLDLADVRDLAEVGGIADVIRGYDPHLILMDLHIGQSNGLSVIRALRDQNLLRDRAVVLVTGETGQDVRDRARAAGAKDVLTKPFTVDQLDEMISAAVRTPPPVNPANAPVSSPRSWPPTAVTPSEARLDTVDARLEKPSS